MNDVPEPALMFFLQVLEQKISFFCFCLVVSSVPKVKPAILIFFKRLGNKNTSLVPIAVAFSF